MEQSLPSLNKNFLKFLRKDAEASILTKVYSETNTLNSVTDLGQSNQTE
jgi:hypothetical protein